MPLIITTNSIPVGCTFYDWSDVAYWTLFGLEHVWIDYKDYYFIPEPKTLFGGSLIAYSTPGDYRPTSVKITYTSISPTHAWEFTIFSLGPWEILGTSGTIPDPGEGTFEVIIPLTFTTHGIASISMNWSGSLTSGSMNKIEFCSTTPPGGG